MKGMTRERQTHSIFEEEWWLEAAAPNQWDVVEIEEAGQVLARLPFVFKKKYGLRIIGQPSLSQTLGPWIRPQDMSQAEKIRYEQELMRRLIAGLPRFDIFHQNFHANVLNWSPFYWEGFSQTTRFSYVLDLTQDPQDLFARASKDIRKTIRRATRVIEVVDSVGVEQVLAMSAKSFARQGLSSPYDPEQFARIDEALARHATRLALHGVDKEGRIHSAAYVVGDEERMYLLASGADPELRKSGSGAYVKWECIRRLSGKTRVFDFEGSMIEPIADFNRKFGAALSSYSMVSKFQRLGRGVTLLRALTFQA